MKLLNWNETITSKCRWAEYAEPLLNGYIILWEHSEDNYQGFANILGYNNGEFKLIEWSYGSCSGCDVYEELSDEEIKKAFIKNMMHFKTTKSFLNYLTNLNETYNWSASSLKIDLNKILSLNIDDYLDNPSAIESRLNAIYILQ